MQVGPILFRVSRLLQAFVDVYRRLSMSTDVCRCRQAFVDVDRSLSMSTSVLSMSTKFVDVDRSLSMSTSVLSMSTSVCRHSPILSTFETVGEVDKILANIDKYDVY